VNSWLDMTFVDSLGSIFGRSVTRQAGSTKKRAMTITSQWDYHLILLEEFAFFCPPLARSLIGFCETHHQILVQHSRHSSDNVTAILSYANAIQSLRVRLSYMASTDWHSLRY